MDNNQDEISLRELIYNLQKWFNYLRSEWKTILIAGLLGSIMGLGYSFYKKPIYKAVLTFALEEKGSGASGLNSIASSFGLNLAGGEGGAFAGDNIIELMKSRYLIEKTLLTKVKIDAKEDFLVNRYIDYFKLKKTWADNTELKDLEFVSSNRAIYSRAQDSILGVIYLKITKTDLDVTKIEKKLSIISVKVKSKDELFAKLFCENLVKNVTSFYIETKVGKSIKNIELLEGRVDSVKQELDRAMYGRANFADQNVGLIRQSAAVPKIKQEMRVQMLSTMYAELVKNLEFSKLALMREEPLIQLIDSPILPLEINQLGKITGLILGFLIFVIISIFILISKKVIRNLVGRELL